MLPVARRLCLVLVWTVAALIVPSSGARAGVSTPFLIVSSDQNNIIVWQRFSDYLMRTEDVVGTGRKCYLRTLAGTGPTLTKTSGLPLSENPRPFAYGVAWLMWIGNHTGHDRLMTRNIDSQMDAITAPSNQVQMACGMSGDLCVYGQNRSTQVNGHFPVDLYCLNLNNGNTQPFVVSDSGKAQFAHDGNLIVYRAFFGGTDYRIFGKYFSGGDEFEIAARNGSDPAVYGTLVVWSEVNGDGWNIVAKDISTGELRTVAYTTANPPRPQVGPGMIFWEDARNQPSTGLDIYGYDWSTGQEVPVTNASGDDPQLRVCGDIITWVKGPTSMEKLWGARIVPDVRITDLRASLVTSDSAQLQWTSAAGPSDPPVAYDLRTRTDAPVTDANWGTSTQVTGLPTLAAAGQTETFAVPSLASGDHYFAIKVRLQSGSYSILSNCICSYVSSESSALDADDGDYISFNGTVTCIDVGSFYVESPTRPMAVKVSPLSGQPSVTIGNRVTVTGKLEEDLLFFGPVLQQATVSVLTGSDAVKVYGMNEITVGGNHPRWGGAEQAGLINVWMLVKTCGKVSGISTTSGCSFFIRDGSKISDNGGQGILVVSPFPAPAGLSEGSWTIVEGVSKVSRSTGRQIGVAAEGKITVLP